MSNRFKIVLEGAFPIKDRADLHGYGYRVWSVSGLLASEAPNPVWLAMTRMFPPDTVIVNYDVGGPAAQLFARPNGLRDCFHIVLASRTWDVLPEGAVIPEIKIQCRREDDESIQCWFVIENAPPS